MKTPRFFLLLVLCGLSGHIVAQDNDDTATQERIKKEASVKEAEAAFNAKQKLFDKAAEELQDARREYLKELSELTRPLLNEMVDLTEKFTESYTSIAPFANQFYLNTEALQRELEELSESVIGVYLQSASDNGVPITRVTEGAPADLAGIESGDVITEIDGVELQEVDDPYETLVSMINAKEAGSIVELKLQRDQEQIDVDVETIDRLSLRTLTAQNTSNYTISPSNFTGYSQVAPGPRNVLRGTAFDSFLAAHPARHNDRIFVMEIEDEFGQYFGVEYGVLVLKAKDVDGIQAGDILLEIDGQPIRSLSHALRYKREADDEVDILFKRNKREKSVTLEKDQFSINAVLQ